MGGIDEITKRQLLMEADEMINHLQSGDATDVDRNKAIAYLIRLLKGFIQTEFVTAMDLEKHFKAHTSTCPAHKNARNPDIKFALGPVTVHGALSNAAIAGLTFLFFIGKGKGWW
jgi:hypothetical protein